RRLRRTAGATRCARGHDRSAHGPIRHAQGRRRQRDHRHGRRLRRDRERRVTVIHDDVPERVLAIYAHPDDPEISAGGTLARWADAGAEVHLVVTTRGDKGTNDPDADLDALAQLRVEETAAAARVLGIADHHHLDHPDGEVADDRSLRLELVRLIRSVRPDAVCCPDPTAVFFGAAYVNHRDH